MTEVEEKEISKPDNNNAMSFREKLKDPEYRRMFIHTLVLFCSNVFLGIRSSQHSVAFLDLAQITGTNTEQAAMFYTAMNVGSLVGNFCIGFLFDKFTNHRLFLLSATCVLGAVTTVAVPWSTSYLLTIFIFFFNQVFHGGYDTGGDSNMMALWGVDGKMFMQFFHFCYSLGAIISPFTVQPFLSQLTSGNSTFCSQTASLNITSNGSHGVPHCGYSASRIHYAYLIAGVLCLLSGIVFAAEGCIYRSNPSKIAQPTDDHRNPRVLPRWLTVLALALISSMYFFHAASGSTLLGFLMPFFVQGLGWSKNTVVQLDAVFSAGYAATRLTAVVVIRWVSPARMLVFSHTIITLSVIGIWISVTQGSEEGVWACIFFAAVGFAFVFPTGIVYLENDVMKVTGRIASVVWVAANIQGFANPPLMGYLLQAVSPMWYVYLALIERCLSFLSFALLVIVVKMLVSKADKVVTEKELPDDEKSIQTRSMTPMKGEVNEVSTAIDD